MTNLKNQELVLVRFLIPFRKIFYVLFVISISLFKSSLFAHNKTTATENDILNECWCYKACLDNINEYLSIETKAEEIKSLCRLKAAIDLAEYHLAEHEINEVLDYLESIDYELIKAEMHLQLSEYYRIKNQFSKSLDYLNAAIKYYEKNEFPDLLANAYVSMAEYFRTLKHFDQAENRLKMALEIDSLRGPLNSKVLSRLYHRYAAVSHENDQIERARKFSLKSLSYSKPAGLLKEQATSYLELGFIYFNSKNEIALDYYKKALDIWSDLNMPHYQANNLHHLIRYYISMGMPDKAVNMTNKLIKICRDRNLEELLPYALEDKAYILSSQDKYEEAFKALDTSLTAWRELIEMQHNNRIEEMLMRFETEEAKEKMEEAKRQRLLAEELASKEKVTRITITIALIFAIAIIGLLIYFNQRVQKRNSDIRSQQIIISEQKEQLEKQYREKDVMFMEMHHRVKNNFNILASLLNLHERKSENPITKKVLRESSHMVQVMNVTHSKLNKTDDGYKGSLKKQLEELLKQIKSTYEVENISFSIEGDEVEVSMRQSVSIGLMVNELVTNSLKHGFDAATQEVENGKINISLSKKQNELAISVCDNGKGIPENLDTKAESVGFKIINALIHELNGVFDITNNKVEHYTEAKLKMPLS